MELNCTSFKVFNAIILRNIILIIMVPFQNEIKSNNKASKLLLHSCSGIFVCFAL